MVGKSSLKGKLGLAIGVLFPVIHSLMGMYGPDMEELCDVGEIGGESIRGWSMGRTRTGAGGVAGMVFPGRGSMGGNG